MDKEENKKEIKAYYPTKQYYIDFISDFGLASDAKIIVQGKYFFTLDNGNKHVDKFELNTKFYVGPIVLFGYKSIYKFFDYENEKWFKPCLIYITNDDTLYFEHQELLLPDWCPYPDEDGNIINEPTKDKILRAMLIDRTYGNFLRKRYIND